jgi:4-amino-4-deoxy-L-arabinose transferase-like glycosyltransferase
LFAVSRVPYAIDDRTRRWLLLTLLLAGAFLRLYQLDRYPLGVHQDELSNIYDGWSIATTGADRFGDSYPGVVRAFGERDYRPALYPWLAAVTQKATGFSIVAGRLPAAILGIASLWLVYAFAREMAGERYALLALLLAALSPLHIQFSRIAHEGGSLTGFFMILALYLWQRSARKDFSISSVVAIGLALGIATNVYQSTRLTAALLTVAVAVDIIRHTTHRIKPLATLALCALIGALPQVIFLVTQPARFAGRAKVLSVTTDNPVSYVATVVHNFMMNLAPHYLFVPPFLRGLTVARLIPTEAPFFYIGLVALAFIPIIRGSRARAYVYIATFIAILPAAITTDNPSTMRTSAIAILTPLFSAAGIVFIGDFLARKLKSVRLYYPAVAGALVLASGAVIYRYTRSEYFRELSFQEIGVRMGKALGRDSKQYDAVIVAPHVSQAYLYIAAFGGITPTEFHRLPKRLYSVGMDRYTQMGKYHFVTESMLPRSIAALRGHGRILFVVPKKVPQLAVVDSVSFRDDMLYFQTY